MKREVALIVIHCSATLRVDKIYTPEQMEQDHKARGFKCAGCHCYEGGLNATGESADPCFNAKDE